MDPAGPPSTDAPTDAPTDAATEDLRIVPFEGSPSDWDAYLEGFPDSTFCHLGGWRTIMAEALGHQPHYRLAMDPVGGVRGVLPMIRVKSRLFGDYLVSMPFLNYGGPLGTEEARRLLGEDAAEKAAELGVDLMELRARTPVPGDLRTSERKLTVLLKLPESSETLWEEGLKAKVRSQIRRPMKEGMEARFGPEEVDRFYRVFATTMRDLGTPVLPQSFFAAVARELGPHSIFCTIVHNEEPVAAGCGFIWNGEVEITWAGARRDYSRKAPNMLLYWSFMEQAIARGAHTFNFGRCSPDSGTHRFKRQWGGEDHPLPWAQWSSGSFDSTPSPTGRKYRLATAAWSKLPLAVTNRIGPLISRSLP